jgi:two-component system nitrate/nitrite response regulator NarL
MPITLVLANDHPIILDGLEEIFRREPDFQVLARCLEGEATLRAVRQHKPDVLILDLRMPEMDGLAVLREMQKEKLPTRVVVLTAALDEDQALEAIRLGVSGVVLKEMASRLLVQCVRKVHAGEQWLEKRSVSLALEKLLKREAAARQIAGLLTPREIEIVRLVVDGLRNKEIADRLYIGEGTVKVHLHSIYEKLKVSSRLQLARYAREKGLV